MKKTRLKQLFIPIAALLFLFTASSYKNDFFEIAKQIEIFTTLFKELNMNYVDETNPAELMDTAIKNMLGELDPYTAYLNEQDVEAFRIQSSGEYSGIGALIRSYENRLVVVEPYEGYPADEAGLKAGDEIIKIGNILVSDYQENAAELLKGSRNSEISLTYVRQGKEAETTLKRSDIEIDAVPFYEMADPETGYVVLSRFNSKASSQLKDAIRDLRAQGARQLILDLRGNPGGLLSEAINVSNLFLPKGELIVSTRSKVKKFNQEYHTKNQPLDENIPLVVLVDGRSASASEIVAGSLQDLDRAVIVGARSFGKGLVQRPLKLNYGTQLKVTISRYYTPSGRCIQALDYWNRDEDGRAVRKREFGQFSTRNGRAVTDQGGIMPDIEIEALKSNAYTRALVEDHLVFDYATQFYYSHPDLNLAAFDYSSEDYGAFVSFVKQRGINFTTPVEKSLQRALSNPDPMLGTQAQQEYRSMLATLEKEKIDALETYRNTLAKEIEDEIVKRYAYREGLYKYYLANDEAIGTAQALLDDQARYKKILGL